MTDPQENRGLYLEDVPRRTVFTVIKAWIKFLLGTVAVGLGAAALLLPLVLIPSSGVRAVIQNWEGLPSELPFDKALPQRIVMTDRDGKPFATLYSENRIPVTLDKISPYVVEALLATEDSRFYEHSGIDVRGIARAFVSNAQGGGRQGASTLTQQYVKNILQYAARTEDERNAAADISFMRKIREARYAIALEKELTKDEILEGYLNTVYFGDGAYGIAAASQHYFKKNAADLTLPEAATLVGILKSTTNYDPTNNLEGSTARRNVVLDRMASVGSITEAQANYAKSKPIELNVRERRNGCYSSLYPTYCQWVKETLLSDPAFGATQEERDAFVDLGGFTVKTALDRTIQDTATEEAVDALGPKNRVAAGIIVMKPGTGEVVAMASNKPWGNDPKKGQTELLLPLLPAYQPGSNFKPIILATALEQGVPISTKFDTPNNYIPENMNHPADGFSNDDDRGHGYIDAYQATAGSVNTWFVKLIEQTGVKPAADMAERLGVMNLPKEGPTKITAKDASLALGAYEVSPLEIATVYSTFDAHGVKCNPVNILEIVDRNGEVLPSPDADCHQAIAPEVADTVTDVLTAPFNGGTANNLKLDDARVSAGKTGTTDNSAATWFTGFTPQYVTSIWIGDPRGGQRYPLKNVRAFGQTYGTVYGSYIAGPIWKNIMNRIHDGEPVMEFSEPGIITSAKPVVPNVVGLSVGAAVEILKAEGYKVAIAEKNAKPVAYAGPDQVFAQDPDGGGQYGIGATVTLRLTSGSNTDIYIE